MKFEFERFSKPLLYLKIEIVAKVIFEMSPFLLYKLNQYEIQRGCLLEAFGGLVNLWSLFYDLLKGFLGPKMVFIHVNFVFQDC